MLLTPLYPLLSTKNEFQWSVTHDQAFQTAKESLTVAPMLSFFDMNNVPMPAVKALDSYSNSPALGH